MKKLIYPIIGIMAFAQSAFAVATTSSSYSTVDAPYINLEVTDLEDGSTRITWDADSFSDLENFSYWKVIQSDDNPDLVYPDDGYIFYDTNVDADSYIDTNPNNGTNYYRVCAITSSKTRYCSSVIEIEIEKADKTYTDNGYRTVINDEDLELELEVQDDGNLLTWEPLEYNNFVYWKVVRSKTNTEPSYPDDGYIFYSNYNDTDEYLDENPISVPVYYRVCAITSDKYRYCSNVIYFDPDDEDNEVTTDDEDEEDESEDTFSDITGSQYKNAIQYVKRKGIVDGYNDGTYQPENKINRAEFTKILILAIYNENDAESCSVGNYSFTDMNGNEWYAPYLCLAKKKGILEGYSDGSFQAGNEINLAEALKVVLLTYDVDLPDTTSDEWYAPYWSYALKNNILPDSVTSVSQEINRGEMAEIIYNLEN